jgi:rSAM/selenodomain-associated transferase 1
MKPMRIVIFAKEPQPGFSKTRLIPALGAQGAATLAKLLLERMLQAAIASEVGVVELCVTPWSSEEVWRKMGVPVSVQLTDQGDGDLGVRMARAAQRVIDAGESVLLVGTDCPQLDAGQLQIAALALQGADAALIPALDGGYVLLGLNQYDASIFSGIAWSTSSVAAATQERLQALQWRVQTLAPLHDIDEPADLQYLPAALSSNLMLVQGFRLTSST